MYIDFYSAFAVGTRCALHKELPLFEDEVF